jgi:hypothetical protein
MGVDDQTDDNSGYKYTEYRKVKKGDDSYYDDILKTPEDNSKKSLFTEELVKYFSFDNFLNNAFSGNIDEHKIKIDCNNQDTLPKITIDLGKDVTTTDDGNTIIDRPTLLKYILDLNSEPKSNLKAYYDFLNLNDGTTIDYENKMKGLNPENEIHAGYMIGVARLVVEYFIYSSILYGIVYYDTTQYSSLEACDKPLIKIKYVNDNAADSDNYEPDDTNVKTYIDYIVHAIFEVIEELNLKNYVFHSYVEDNVNYNKTFLKNNGLLKTKEKDFNNKKSTLITMMSKSKKMERQYSSHSFWNMIYLIVLITYILGLVGLSYFGMTLANEETKRLMAIVLICVASLVLTGMFSYKLVLYLFFNK